MTKARVFLFACLALVLAYGAAGQRAQAQDPVPGAVAGQSTPAPASVVVTALFMSPLPPAGTSWPEEVFVDPPNVLPAPLGGQPQPGTPAVIAVIPIAVYSISACAKNPCGMLNTVGVTNLPGDITADYQILDSKGNEVFGDKNVALTRGKALATGDVPYTGKSKPVTFPNGTKPGVYLMKVTVKVGKVAGPPQTTIVVLTE